MKLSFIMYPRCFDVYFAQHWSWVSSSEVCIGQTETDCGISSGVNAANHLSILTIGVAAMTKMLATHLIKLDSANVAGMDTLLQVSRFRGHREDCRTSRSSNVAKWSMVSLKEIFEIYLHWPVESDISER